MISEFNPWDENNPVILPLMKNDLDNIRIITDQNATNNLCVIFFSSNGIYYPNTQEEFVKKIVEEDRFDYWNIAKEISAAKKIFLRDLHKQWYVTGVNCHLNSADRVLEFLKKETEGFDIITIGSSAGGYAATLFGVKLGAKVLCYSGQFDISQYKDGITRTYNSLLFHYKTSRGGYYDLRDLISKADTKIYYFLPYRSKDDIIQYHLVEQYTNVIPIRFCYEEHSRTHPPILIPYVIEHISELDQFENVKKELTGYEFSIKLMGWPLANYFGFKRIVIKIKRLFAGGRLGAKQ